MKRRSFLALAGLAGIGACASQEAAMRRNPYYSGPPSDHFDGNRFFNPGGTPPNSLRDLLRWRFGGERQPWPDTVPVQQSTPPATDPDLRVTMVGHATLLIQIAGRNILTDPLWSDRASPVGFAGPKRVTAPGIAFDDLPAIDLILLSHNHYDHLDVDTLRRLHAAHAPRVITPLGNDTIVRNAVPGINVTAHDWGDAVPFSDLIVHLDPCHHWSARNTADRSAALWASFTLTGAGGGPVAFIGDTGFDDGRPFRALNRHGPLRLLIQPIGAYAPRWFMKGQHQNPAEAVAGMTLAKAATCIGHHWGTFQLTDEARLAPPKALTDALIAHSIPADRFQALAPGQVWRG